MYLPRTGHGFLVEEEVCRWDSALQPGTPSLSTPVSFLAEHLNGIRNTFSYLADKALLRVHVWLLSSLLLRSPL